MLDQFKSARARRQFLLTTALVCVVLVGILYALSYWKHTVQIHTAPGALQPAFLAWVEGVQLLIGSVAGGAITAGFLVFVFGRLYAQESQLHSVEVLDSVATKAWHDEALDKTEVWQHNGHIGRWVRSRALVRLRETAQERGIPNRATLILIDPRSESTCAEYSRYRTLLSRRRTPDIDDIDEVKIQILATVAVAATMNEDPRLDVDIYFKTSFDTERLDLSDTVAFRTLADPGNVAVAYVRGAGGRRHSFYEAARLSYQNAVAAADHFVAASGSVPTSGELEDFDVDLFLDMNGFGSCLDATLRPALLEQIHSTSHPFR